MPCVVGHAANHNDVMCASCDMHELASWASLSIHDAPRYTCWQGMCMYQTTSNKIDHFTFHVLNNENANTNMLMAMRTRLISMRTSQDLFSNTYRVPIPK